MINLRNPSLAKGIDIHLRISVLSILMYPFLASGYKLPPYKLTS